MKTNKTIAVFLFLFLFVLCMPGRSSAQKLKIKVIVDQAKVYLEPILTSSVITNVPAGAVFEVQKTIGEFYEVNLPPDENGFVKSGFIQKSAVEEIESEDMPEKTQEETPPPVPKKEVTPPQQPPPPPPAEKVITALPPPAKRPEPVAFETRRDGGVEIGFRLFGNFLFTMSDNDFNTYSESMEKAIGAIVVPPWVTVTTNSELMKHAYGGGGEFYVNVLPYLGIGFGAGYIQQNGESGFEVADNLAGASEGMQISSKVSAVPVTFSLYFNIPAGQVMNFSLYGGLGLYLGNVEWNTLWSVETSTLWGENEHLWKAKSNALGFHGGLNFEFNIGGAFAFIMGVNGRVVKFSDLTADLKETVKTSMGPTFEFTYTNQTLWYFEEYYSGQWYSYAEIDDSPPSSPFYRNIRKAEISLGGIALVAGFKIRIK
ncbi:MAG: hypothetical protein JXB26_14285 [Candidatus Aminicenantes bacterium]|nr:hypothetical protein [Candidatus Aminicenantes bacterium]